MRSRQNILSKYICDNKEVGSPSADEIERRIALYSQRAEYGLDLFEDTILPESPLTNDLEAGIIGSLEFDWADELEEILSEQEQSV